MAKKTMSGASKDVNFWKISQDTDKSAKSEREIENFESMMAKSKNRSHKYVESCPPHDLMLVHLYIFFCSAHSV